ncbi:Rz1-like lysis system protein LysC [Pantoea ananatis]|uniref:Rz1-like lysis system protein LysC n=1 Tax=Pantoea ananas TaxID=553 RepID=UPI003BF7A8B3
MLAILCLPVLLTSCARTEREFKPSPLVPITPELLVDCEVPDIPEHMTYGDSLELNEKLLTVIENCNLDKAAIRDIEQSRIAN